jgi:hypothetical protein
MHQEANSATENRAAVETSGGAARAHPDGVAPRERYDAAIAEAMGVSLSTVNRAHMAYDAGGIKALKPKPIGGRQRHSWPGMAGNH